MTATIGIIGAGHLIRHMMPTLAGANGSERFLISERGRETSADLARRFGCTVEPDNQRIVDASDIIILAVRPYDTAALAKSLAFRDGQRVISLAAGVSHAELSPLVAPARLAVAMPVVAAEFGESPTLLYPDDASAKELLARCGPVIVLEDESQFMPAAVHACVYGWFQRLIDEMQSWTIAQGISPDTARLLTAQMMRAGATVARERTNTAVADLVSELATPRSFTGAGLRKLDEKQVFDAWTVAMDHVLARLRAGSAD
ncbi:MAG: NAD(P)-binding domain-containing protein [Hyphomicrobiales bacterium]